MLILLYIAEYNHNGQLKHFIPSRLKSPAAINKLLLFVRIIALPGAHLLCIEFVVRNEYN